MKTYKIAVIAGDGIGPEVIAEGVKVLKKVAELDGTFNFEFTHFPWGCEYYLENGCMMPEDGIETLSVLDNKNQTVVTDMRAKTITVIAKGEEISKVDFDGMNLLDAKDP